MFQLLNKSIINDICEDGRFTFKCYYTDNITNCESSIISDLFSFFYNSEKKVFEFNNKEFPISLVIDLNKLFNYRFIDNNGRLTKSKIFESLPLSFIEEYKSDDLYKLFKKYARKKFVLYLQNTFDKNTVSNNKKYLDYIEHYSFDVCGDNYESLNNVYKLRAQDSVYYNNDYNDYNFYDKFFNYVTRKSPVNFSEDIFEYCVKLAFDNGDCLRFNDFAISDVTCYDIVRIASKLKYPFETVKNIFMDLSKNKIYKKAIIDFYFNDFVKHNYYIGDDLLKILDEETISKFIDCNYKGFEIYNIESIRDEKFIEYLVKNAEYIQPIPKFSPQLYLIEKNSKVSKTKWKKVYKHLDRYKLKDVIELIDRDCSLYDSVKKDIIKKYDFRFKDNEKIFLNFEQAKFRLPIEILNYNSIEAFTENIDVILKNIDTGNLSDEQIHYIDIKVDSNERFKIIYDIFFKLFNKDRLHNYCIDLFSNNTNYRYLRLLSKDDKQKFYSKLTFETIYNNKINLNDNELYTKMIDDETSTYKLNNIINGIITCGYSELYPCSINYAKLKGIV